MENIRMYLYVLWFKTIFFLDIYSLFAFWSSLFYSVQNQNSINILIYY